MATQSSCEFAFIAAGDLLTTVRESVVSLNLEYLPRTTHFLGAFRGPSLTQIFANLADIRFATSVDVGALLHETSKVLRGLF